MSEEARQQLARLQAQLVGALVEGTTAPADFDGSRLAAAAEALISKRARAVARAWPQLARVFGDEFAASFASYARAHRLPCDASPMADGRAFIAWLDGEGRLTDEARLEAFAFDARYRVRNAQITPRRGPSLRILRLSVQRRLIVVIRLPFVGERWLTTDIL
ncbi:MAG TPA: hypothetical protein VJ464_00735 [Blastocatellia bacterium]|nr:hypothetical protein [Blastocatellia bacterium]